MEKPSDQILGKTDDIPAVMRVESSTLEPITINDNNARFVFENKGILSRDTVLQFQLVTGGGVGFLPIGSGIYSLIKKATLRVGAKRICEITDIPFYRSMTHAYNTPSYRANYVRFMKGINNTLVPNQLGTSVGGVNANVDAGKFQPTGGEVAVSTFVPEDTVVPNDMKLTSSADTTPCWSIYLRELFPILESIELPLFLMNEEVVVELEFNKQTTAGDVASNGVGTLCCFESDSAAPPNLVEHTCSLVKDSCLMFVDTIYYANERMEDIDRQTDATKGMALKYTDVISNVASMGDQVAITPPALRETEVIHQLPLSGFSVKNVFWCFNAPARSSLTNAGQQKSTPEFYNPLYGKYAMLATPKSSTFDMRVNDSLVFPEPITNPALKATEASLVYNSPVYLHTALYSRDSYTTKTGEFADDALALPVSESKEARPGGTYRLFGGIEPTEMLGGQHFEAVNLSTMPGDANDDSIYINQKPIEVLHRKFPTNQHTNFRYNAYYFAEVVKGFALKNGNVVIQQGPSVLMAQ
tara:strand:- start:297 stop:1880 length:1584 start_codon:yes stop_codon:yes gene_type:complete